MSDAFSALAGIAWLLIVGGVIATLVAVYVRHRRKTTVALSLAVALAGGLACLAAYLAGNSRTLAGAMDGVFALGVCLGVAGVVTSLVAAFERPPPLSARDLPDVFR